MKLEDFKKKGGEVEDAAKADMPEIVGKNLDQLHTFEPGTNESEDVMPPLPEENDDAAKFIRDAEAEIRKGERKE